MLELSKTEDEVFVLSSPLPRPLHKVAVHTWLVTNKVGASPNRWEVWQFKNRCENSWGHVHKNLLPLEAGMPRSTMPGKSSDRWDSKVIGKVQGEVASKMIRYINLYAPHYLFSHWYFLWPGPNSNTFVQWIINRFKEIDLKLPVSAHGAGFSILAV